MTADTANPDYKTTLQKLKLREMWETLPPGMESRHPLQTEWTLWYLKGDRSKDWEDCLKQIITFDSIEGFWSIFNHIIPPTFLTWGSDFYLFRKGIKPMWEDANNISGGRWLVSVDRNKRQQLLDHYWMELIMAITGEQFEENSDEICGAVVNVRQKGDKVAVWTRNAVNDVANYEIGESIYHFLHLDDKVDVIRYEVHKDASARTGSKVKPRLTFPSKPNKSVSPSLVESR